MSESSNLLSREELIAELRECAQRYRAVFENADIGIFHLTQEGKWTSANPTLALLLRYDTPAELLKVQPDFNGKFFVDPAQRDSWFEGIRTKKRHADECAVYTKDGRILWVNLSGHQTLDAYDATGFECTLYDVTERRKTEIAMTSAKEQADFANRSKSEFLANMSHELRTPLNAIIGFAEIIKDQMFGNVGVPQYVEYAKDIYDSGQLLLSLINDILDMSKIEAGKRQLKEVALDIDDVVTSVSRLVAARAKEGRVRMSLMVPKNLPALKGEEKAIKQILTNLLTNAVKFTNEGGQVTLTAKIDQENRMVISVADTGIGIAPKDIPVALAPFGQIESSLSRKHQGTGLGLPLTKALVELHEGTLNLESELGKGTTVTLTFPSERVVPRNEEREPGPGAQGSES